MNQVIYTPLVPGEALRIYTARYNQIATNREFNLQLREYNQALFKRELQELDTLPPKCSIEQQNELLTKWSSLVWDKVNQVNVTDFYCSSSVQALSCLSYVLTHPVNNESSANANLRIRETITNLRVFGTPSENGIALNPKLGDVTNNTSNLFVFKAPRKPNDLSLIHEIFIALQGTNRLRNEIPNFALVFGGFFCSPPELAANKKDVVTWCNSPNQGVQYAIYENIFPSIPMSEAVKTLPATEIVNILYQTFYALSYAHKEVEFTHYDLHSNNVLLRDLGEIKIVRYPTYQGYRYFKTRYIPTIIDYGNSFIKVNGNKYGSATFVEIDQTTYKSFPLADIFRLVGSMLTNVIFDSKLDLRRYKLTIDMLTCLYQLFYTATVTREFLKSDLKAYLGLPRKFSRDEITHDQFIKSMDEVLSEKLPELFQRPFMYTTPPPNSAQLSNQASCPMYREILNLDQPIEIHSQYEFYQLYQLLYRNKNQTELNNLVQRYSPQPYFKTEVETSNNKLKNIIQQWTTIRLIDIFNQFISTDNINRYFIEFNSIYGELQSLNENTRIMFGIIKIYPRLLTNEFKLYFDSYVQNLNQLNDDLSNTVNKYLSDLQNYNQQSSKYYNSTAITRIQDLQTRIGLPSNKYNITPSNLKI